MAGVVELIGALFGSKAASPGGAPTVTPTTTTSANQLNPAQLANAVRAARGDLQTQTSGGVSPDYLTQLIQTQYGSQAGNPGAIGVQSALQWGGGTSFGTPSTSGTTLAGVPFGNASSAGASNTGLATQPQGGFNISEWLQRLQGQAA